MSYTLRIDWEPYQKLQAYTSVAKGEIGGLGRVSIDEKKGELTITEVFLIEQEASTAECELSAEGVAQLYSDLITEGKDVDDIMLWWHSHGDMKSFFSKTDDETMNEWPGHWIVGLVINKKDELEARLQIQKPLKMYMELDIAINYPRVVDDELVKAEVEAKVKHTTYVPSKSNLPTTYNYGYGKYKQQQWWMEEEKDEPVVSHHRMTDAEYQKMMGEDIKGTPLKTDEAIVDAEVEVDPDWDAWVDEWMKAEMEDNTVMKLSLIEDALDKGILEPDEVDAFLNT